MKKINWASPKTLHFQRLYNVELEGKVEKAQKLPFESYEQVFETGNEVLKNKYAYKIISNYVVGYSESTVLVGTALEVLTGSQDLLSLATKTHHEAQLGKDRSQEFYKELNDNLKN